MGVKSIHSIPGYITGPPADKEQAVDPVGVEKSIPKFIECLKQCALLGNSVISKLLFECYCDGSYMKPDAVEARKWLKLYYQQIKENKNEKNS